MNLAHVDLAASSRSATELLASFKLGTAENSSGSTNFAENYSGSTNFAENYSGSTNFAENYSGSAHIKLVALHLPSSPSSLRAKAKDLFGVPKTELTSATPSSVS
jgi:hypothetical protein